MIFKFRYTRLQIDLIDELIAHKIKFKVKRDKSIELSAKWLNKFEEIVAQMINDRFSYPIFEQWNPKWDFTKYIHVLADHNIPFVVEQWDSEIRIITEDCDTFEIFGINKLLFS